MKRLIPVAAAAAAALLYAGPASAFVCVPHIYNCFCSYQSPCPTTEARTTASVSDLLARLRMGVRIIGETDPSLDSSPVSAESIGSASIALSDQMVRNALRGPRNSNKVSATYPRAPMQLPEARLPREALPAQAAGAASGVPDRPEDFGSARDRVAGTTRRQENLGAVQEEKFRLAREESQRNIYINAYARAIANRQRLQELADVSRKLEDEAARATSIGEDFRANANARMAVASLGDEVMEMLGLYASVRGTDEVWSRGSPVMAEQAPPVARHTPDPAITRRWSEDLAFSQALSDFDQKVEKARGAHNALSAIQKLQQERPILLSYIEEHEARKKHFWDVEQDLKATLAKLYYDPDRAWAALAPRMRQLDTTDYSQGRREMVAAQAALALDAELQAQQPVTAYGKRRPNTTCSRSWMDADNVVYCPPYEEVSWLGNVGAVKSINAFYEQYHREEPYRISSAPVPSYGSEPTSGASYYLIQYWLEAQKRKLYWDALRRGEGNDIGPVTSSPLWSELVRSAPQCLYGPIPTTAANIASRPDLFDVVPGCQHRTWSSGTSAGRPIEDVHLGGLDRSVWMIDDSIARYNSQHGGRAEVDGLIAQAESAYAGSPLAGAGTGGSAQMDRIAALRSVIGAMKADRANASLIQPRR